MRNIGGIVIDNLKELLDDHQIYHSDFQMDNFITIRAGETQYGQYKQALRELFKRYRGLKEIYVAKELLQVDIDESTENCRLGCGAGFIFEERRDKINLAKHKMDMEDLEKNIEHTEREFKRFFAQADSLKKAIGELTPEKRNKFDQEMWIHKLKSMVAIDYLTKGRISENAIAFIMSLSKELRIPLLAKIKNHDELIAWFENYDQTLPPLQIEENINIQKLLG